MATPTSTRETQLPPEQIGYLAGGPGRAAETALARLLDADLVRVSRDGRVSAVQQQGCGTTTGLEAAILKSARTSIWFHKAVRTAAKGQEARAVHRHLLDAKLMRPGRKRTAVWWLLLSIGVLLGLLGILMPGFFLGAIAFIGTGLWLRGRLPLTRAGKAALAGTQASDRVLAVARYGFFGTAAGQEVHELFELPKSVVNSAPGRQRAKSGKRRTGSAAGASSCGGGCGSSWSDNDSGGSGGSSDSGGGSSCGSGCGGGGD